MRWMRILPRFRHAYQALTELAAREQWPRAELEAFQLEKLNAIWRHAARWVPYYCDLRLSAGLPDHFTTLDEFRQRMPMLNKATVRSLGRKLLSERPQKGHWTRTGGSTGAPMDVFWGDIAHRQTLWGRYRFLDQWGIDLFDRCAFLWGHRASLHVGMSRRLAALRIATEDRLRNRIRLSAYELAPQQLRDHLRRIEAFQPRWIYAYSTAAYLLAREAIRVGFRGDFLKAVVLTSEPAYPRLVETVRQAFGVPVLVEYGSIETGFLAATAPDGLLRVREDNVMMETIANPRGTWDIVVTMLGNPSFPLFRYAMDDVADAPLDKPECGFASIGSIAGRNNDCIVSRTGEFIHATLVECVLEVIDSVRRYQVHQLADGTINVLLEVEPDAGQIDVRPAAAKLEDLSKGCPVNVQAVTSLPESSSGKNRWIRSDLFQLRGCYSSDLVERSPIVT